MVASTLVLYGFFELLHGERKLSPRRSDPSAFTNHAYYTTAIQCEDDSGLGADFRIFARPSDPIQPHGTVAFLNSRVHIPSNGQVVILEGVRLAAVPGNPKEKTYQKTIPDIPYAMAYGVGLMKEMLSPPNIECEKSFTVETTDFIHEENQLCVVWCVALFHCP